MLADSTRWRLPLAPTMLPHTTSRLCILTLLLAGDPSVGTPCAVAAQSVEGDAFAESLVGEWAGSGEYQGNELALTRTWSVELRDHFLRGDMAVAMPNGASFGALTYWVKSGPESYDVTWMDGTGRMQRISADRDPDSGLVVSEYTDDFTQGRPEERRWEFEVQGPDDYTERLFRRSGTGWELLAEWTFERTGR